MWTPENLVILPLLIPLSGALIALLLRNQRNFQPYWSLGAMVVSAASAAWLLVVVVQTDAPLVYHSGNWLDGNTPIGITLVGDHLSATMVLMSQLVMVMGMLYGTGAQDACVRYPTFYPLFLMLATGLSGTFLTGDLFNLFVFAELLVIAGAVLTAVSDDRYGTEAAYKYFYISLLAAAFLLLANGAFYATYGTLNMATIAARNATTAVPPLGLAGAALLAAAFMIKCAAFPFHFWQPDFHTAAPTPVHAVLSSVVVKLGVYGLLRMTTLLFPAQAALLQSILLVVGVIGVFYGGLGATGTYDAKRMLAYSTMGQIGYILVGIGWGTPLAAAAAVVFAFNHSLVKAAMLMLAGAVASRAPIKSADFQIVTGVGKKAPAIGALFLLGSLGLAGIPPTNGFVGKLLLFQSGVAAAGYWPLALIGVGSLITLVYTMRAFMRIWWTEPTADTAAAPAPAKPKKGDSPLAPTLLIAGALFLGVWPAPLVQLATNTAAYLTEPARYIAAVLGG